MGVVPLVRSSVLFDPRILIANLIKGYGFISFGKK
jgi:hypothetical protein